VIRPVWVKAQTCWHVHFGRVEDGRGRLGVTGIGTRPDVVLLGCEQIGLSPWISFTSNLQSKPLHESGELGLSIGIVFYAH